MGICCQPGIVLCTKSTYSYSYVDQSYISCFRCTDRRTLYLSGGNCVWCDTGNEICIYDRIGSACMLDQRSSPAFKRALILASVAANIFYAGNSYSIFPVLAAEAGEVIIALQLRSHGNKGRTRIIQHLPYIVKPLLARCIRRSQTLALSVVSRGLFLAKQQSYEIWDLREKIVCLFLMGIITAAGISKLMYALSQQGIYFGALRIVYDWTKLYL